MASGEIGFGLPDKPVQLATITNGAYSGNAVVGENRVEVYLWDNVTDPTTNMPMKTNKLPAQFNTATAFKATVTQAGPNEFNFEVTSK